MGGKADTNFGDIAASQGEENREVIRDQVYANRPTQYTPWGYTSWDQNVSIDPATGQPVTEWSQTQGLTPELQDILNKQIALQGGRTDLAGGLVGRMGSEFGSPMDFSNLQPGGYVPTQQFTMPEGGIGDPNTYRQRGENASYDAAMNRVTPAFEEQRRAMETKLSNQGLQRGDRAYDAAMEGINMAENDARNQAIWGAQQAGRQESALNWGQQMGQNQNMFNQALGANNQNFGQSMQASQLASQLRQQQMTEQMQQRGFSLNEINALLSGQQVGMPQMPNFNPAGSATPAPIYQGAADQASMDNANSPWGGLANLAGTLGGAYLGTM